VEGMGEEKLLPLKLVAPRGRGRRYYMLYLSRTSKYNCNLNDNKTQVGVTL